MRHENTPERIARISGGFQEARVLLLGVELGLFERLDGRPTTAAELAAELDATLRGVEIVCDALVAMELLHKEESAYVTRPDAAAILCPGRPGSMTHILRHHAGMFQSWARLHETVRRGLAVPEHEKDTLTDPAANRAFILGMAEVSRPRLGPVVDHLPLDGARHFVDVGGGPAHYACEAVRRDPRLTATLVDLPLTVEVAKGYIASQGLTERVRTVVCDFYHEEHIPLAEPADVVFVSQVLHAEGPDENRALLRKIAPHVRPGGWVVVSENMVGADRTSPAAGALFAVNMLAGTQRGRTYTEAEVAGWLREAGLVPEPVDPVLDRTWLLRARKPT